jgi:hypothetical protein
MTNYLSVLLNTIFRSPIVLPQPKLTLIEMKSLCEERTKLAMKSRKPKLNNVLKADVSKNVFKNLLFK